MRTKVLITLILSTALATSVLAQEVELDDLLDTDVAQLMDISVISASKHLEKISSVLASVKVITAAQIRERGYFVLEDVLADLPGFQFRNTQSFNSYSFLRGIPNQNNLILVLIDGIQINELNSGGYYGGAHYNLSNVQRIEVVYGPASALYGTNAISGIINIITKKPNRKSEGEVKVSLGNFETTNIDASYSYYNKEDDIGLRLAGMVKSSDRLDLAGPEGDYNWTDDVGTWEDDYAVDASLVSGSLNLSLNYQKKSSAADAYRVTVGTDNLEGTNWSIEFLNLHGSYQFKPSDTITITPKIYYRNATVLDDSLYIRKLSGQSRYYRPNNQFGMEVLVDSRLTADLQLISGLLYERDRLAERFSITTSASPFILPPQPPEPAMLENDLISLFSQANLKLGDHFQFVGGLRLDSSSVYDQVLTPRAGLIFNCQKLTTKILVAEAYRAPKPWDYTISLGNPDLLPEEMISFELINSLQLTDSIRLGLSLFRNEMDNLFVRQAQGEDYRWINSGELEVKGFELEGEYQTTSFSAYLNYTWLSSEESGVGDIAEIAEHGANFGLTWSLDEKYVLNFRGNYWGTRENPHPINTYGDTTVDEALVFNANFMIKNIESFDLMFTLRNLMDEDYYHTSNRPPGRYRQQQRAAIVSLIYHF